MTSLLESLLSRGLSRLRVGAGPWLSGDITAQPGAGMAIDAAGNVLTFSATGAGAGVSLLRFVQDGTVRTYTGEVGLNGQDGVRIFVDDLESIGIGLNGTLLPEGTEAPLTSAIARLRYTASAVGTGNGWRIQGQDGTTQGGDVELAGGDGTAKGRVLFGYISAGLFNETLSWNHNTLNLGGGHTIASRAYTQSGGIAATPWLHTQDLTAGTLASAIAATIGAWRFRYTFSDTTRTPLELQYDRVIVSGRLSQQQAASSVVSAHVDNVSVDTATVTATPIASYTMGLGEIVTVTVALQHDNGTTSGRTLYTHTFRRSTGGSSSATGSAEDLSVPAKKLGHGATITLTGATIDVNVVAAAATATKHRGQVSWEIGSIA